MLLKQAKASLEDMTEKHKEIADLNKANEAKLFQTKIGNLNCNLEYRNRVVSDWAGIDQTAQHATALRFCGNKVLVRIVTQLTWWCFTPPCSHNL